MTSVRRWWFAALASLAGCQSNSSDAQDAGTRDAQADVVSHDVAVVIVDAGFETYAGPCTTSSPLPCPPLTYPTWRMPSPPGVPSDVAASYAVTDQTATEANSKLTWQRTFTEKKTWRDAVAYCADLSLGGFDDWRLPSRIELVSLVDFTRLPSIDQEAFPNTANDYFWSASPTSTRKNFYFSLYFGAGLTAFGIPDSASAHVRCVRGGGPGLLPRFTLTDSTALDRNTQLTWQRQILDQPLSWESANDYCRGLKNGWRLPSNKELQTIVDETTDHPTADLNLFPDTPAASFWTSTPVNKSGLSSAVYVDMRDGINEEAGTNEAFWVRCVR
jgi:hypothetical protein